MRPATEQYGADDRPSFGVTFLSAVQHLAAIAPPALVLPVLVAHHAHAAPGAINAMLSSSMLALGAGCLLLCGRWRWLGSGYLAPATFTAAYLPACFGAAELGGMPLVAGMMIFAGICEMLFSHVVGRLRPYLPTEIAGLAVAMIGVVLGILGFRLMFGMSGTGARAVPALSLGTALGLASLAGIIGVTLWGPRALRMHAVLIVLAAAWAVAAWLGEVDLGVVRAGFAHGVIGLPRLPGEWPRFAPELAFEFAVTALASSLRAVGDLTTCQKINDADWQRPDMGKLKRGLLADGLGNVLAGALGTMGMSPFSGSIGLSVATGVKARRVGLMLGGIFIVMAFFPGATGLVASIPLPVSGAILLFSACFILINGLKIILSRLLDHRKVLIVGLGLTFGLSHDVFPNFFRDLPGLAPLAASALAEALIVAIVLNALFRLGMRRTARLTLAPGEDAVGRVHAFCEEQGGAWGARRDVMQRVTAALVEFAEESGELVQAGSEADIEVTFDEFHVGALVRYPGRALAGGAAETGLPARPVSLEDGELPVDLARRIIRRMADKFTSGSEGGRQWLKLGFEH